MARGLGSRRRLRGVGWLEAGRRRTRARGAIIARSARLAARSLRALGGGHCGDDSLALGVGAVASVFEVTAVTCDGDGTRVAAAAAWRRLAGGRPTPHASSRRDHCALGSLGARSLRALGGGHCGDDSLALGVGAVASVR